METELELLRAYAKQATVALTGLAVADLNTSEAGSVTSTRPT